MRIPMYQKLISDDLLEDGCPSWKDPKILPTRKAHVALIPPPFPNGKKWTVSIKCIPLDVLEGPFKCPYCCGKFPKSEKNVLRKMRKMGAFKTDIFPPGIVIDERKTPNHAARGSNKKKEVQMKCL